MYSASSRFSSTGFDSISVSFPGKRLGHDLMFILVNHVAYAFSLQHPHPYSVILQDCNQRSRPIEMRVGVILKPANGFVLFAIKWGLRGSKPRRSFQVLVERLTDYIVLLLFEIVELAFIAQVTNGLKNP